MANNFTITQKNTVVNEIQSVNGAAYCLLFFVNSRLDQVYITDAPKIETTTAMPFDRLGDAAEYTNGMNVDVFENINLMDIFEQLTNMELKGKLIASDEIAYLLSKLNPQAEFTARVLAFVQSIS